MVCDKCEDKLSKLIVPDKWTDGARNTTGGKDGGRVVGKEKVEKRRRTGRFTPLARACKICKATVAEKMHYCNQCAYKKAICAMCGRRVLDTKELKMTQLPTIESIHDEELAQLEHATPSPWNDAGTESFLLTKSSRPTDTKSSKGTTNRQEKTKSTIEALPVITNNNTKEFVRKATLSPRHGGLDSSPVTKAYNKLLAQTEAMAITRTTNTHRRYLHEQALLQGIEQLSGERVQREKEIIRFNALKNEVDIFQQFLDPFVFEMRTPREHGVHSSVYRHFIHMQEIQDLGIPIYSLGAYHDDPDDKILTPRTDEKFYRRIRRRTAADFMDASLVSRPTPRRPRQPKNDE